MRRFPMPMPTVASAHRTSMDLFTHFAVSPILVSAAETGYTKTGLKISWLRVSRNLATSLLKGGTRMKSLKLHLFVFGCMIVGLCSPAWATYPVLTFGETVPGKISAAAQTNSYTFSANAGDVIDITMTTTSGSLNPKIQLLEADGTLIKTVEDPNCFAGPQEMNTVRLPLSPPIGVYLKGTYVVAVSDCGDANTGAYALYIQRTNNPGEPVPFPFGQTLTGKIGLAAQNNTYTFIATAGDVVDITMTTTLGSLNPKIRLYEPNGTLLSSASDPNCFSGPQEMNTIKLPVSGTYAVLVGDCADTYTGSYGIYAQRLNEPGG